MKIRSVAQYCWRRVGGGLVLTLAAMLVGPLEMAAQGARFEVTFPAARSAQPLDGRLILVVAREGEREPRFQFGAGPSGQPGFGIDVEAWAPGTPAVIDGEVFGFPLRSLDDLPAGEYWVQALVNRYETFHRSDGHVVSLPPDRGEGQQWNRKPGNLYSTPRKVRIDPSAGQVIRLSLDNEIPAITPPDDTKYVRHIRMKSELLSEFWGRPMYLGAHVLLPEGFDEHPEARYPIAIFHGHFPGDFGGWRTEPPDPDVPCEYSERFQLDCYNRIQQEHAYRFYQEWTGSEYPLRMIIVEIQHPTPYYDDSYAVNSENNGPYGDALTHELIPYIEEQFQGLGEGWARFLYGGSTGGWEALAVQVLYPEEYNGAFGACPDPIDFRAYTLVNLYEDQNAYFLDGDWYATPRPGHRDWLGHVSQTLEEDNLAEVVLGSRGRSGGQWDIWQAVYSPVAADGYPQPIWDKTTGEIDPEVAEFWKQNYDLSHILRRDWEHGLGEKLEGKLHIYVGDMDNYYLNNAVYLVEDFLESTTDPYYGGEVDYGDRAEHCWNGDQTRPNGLSRLRYNQNVCAENPPAAAGDGSGGGGHHELAVLRGGERDWAVGSPKARRDGCAEC